MGVGEVQCGLPDEIILPSLPPFLLLASVPLAFPVGQWEFASVRSPRRSSASPSLLGFSLASVLFASALEQRRLSSSVPFSLGQWEVACGFLRGYPVGCRPSGFLPWAVGAVASVRLRGFHFVLPSLPEE